MTYDQLMNATVTLSQHTGKPITMVYWQLVNRFKPLLGEWILLYRCEQLRGNTHDVFWESRLDPDLVAEISVKWSEPDPMAVPKVAELCWRWRKDPDAWRHHFKKFITN
jgi:hypothetical protein